MKYFGTDGIRGKVNKVITADLALKIGTALGNLSNEKINVIIGMDTRQSCMPLANVIAAGINSTGNDAVIVGVIPTPGISYLTSIGEFSYGIVISASHNPFEDNGIKIFGSDGQKISLETEMKIEELIDLLSMSSENIEYGKTSNDVTLIDKYVDYLLQTIETQKLNLNIALDLANGATTTVAEKVFKKLGSSLTIIGDEPNGVNINKNVGSTHIEALQAVVKNGDFDCGFSFDGDGDRIIMVDNLGNVIDGDYIIYLLAEKLKSENKLKSNKVVMTVMTNLAIIEELKNIGIEVEVCSVGDKYVSRALVKDNLVLGGEQSGHIIMREFAESGDGILVALQLAEFISKISGNVNEKVAHIKLNPQTLKNVKVESKDTIMQHPSITEKINQVETQLKGKGRVLLRASGTEELIRIMVEAQTEELCQQVTAEIEQLIAKI
jgi:phosphoglucosamine mutase